MSFKIVVDDVADALQGAILAMDQPVRLACTAAIQVAGQRVLYYGQANISQAGLGAKFSKAWHVKIYPGKPSIDAAAWAYHKIPFASIFEDGGTIHGKPMLWIPLRNAPKFVGRGRVTPKRLRAQGIKLFSIERAGKEPLLATKIYGSAGASKKTNFNVTFASLRKSRTVPRNPASKLVRITVPLFFGIQAVTLKKITDLASIAQAERDALPDYYAANLKVE